MILADKVIKLRKQRGWSQEELANQLNGLPEARFEMLHIARMPRQIKIPRMRL